MHELAMAQSIINSVIETAEENEATEVNEVIIEIGKLVLINPEQLSFLLDVLTENTIADNAKFEINEMPVEIECSNCNFHGNANTDDLDHYAPIIECPKCENKAIKILNGKDCIVKNIIIEKED